VKNQKERSIGPLMGIAMKKLRGKASGEMINKLLLKNIKKKLASI
jgi:glutamyl-tRNA(Gln) amidotransferase subunit E